MTKRAKIEKLLEKMANKKGASSSQIGFNNVKQIEFFKTPFSTVNSLMGGGIPKGQFSIIAGPAGTGKTTFLQQVVANLMKEDPDFHCLWTDVENSLEHNWCEKLGIDLDRIIVQRYSSDNESRHMEAILQQGIDLIESGTINMWIIDSIGALTPSSEINKELAEGKMLDLQRKLGEFFRKSSPLLYEHNISCIMTGQVYNAPTTTGVGLEEVRGGNSVKHWAYVRLKTRRGRKDLGPGTHKIPMPDGTIKDIPKGWGGVFKLDKSKTNANEGKEVILQFMSGRGFDSEMCAISSLFANNVFERRGAWYYHKDFPGEEGNKKIQGKDAVIEFLLAHPKLREQLVNELDVDLALQNESHELAE